MRGNFHLFRFTLEDHNKALECFNRAIDLDPSYALAYSALAAAHLARASFATDEEARLSEDAARKAIDLDPTIAEAHSALAAVQFWFKCDLRGSEESFARALELSPSSSLVRHYYSWMLIATGRFEMAEAHLRRALELDPMSPVVNVDQGLPFFFARRYDLAIEHYERALKWAYNFWYAHFRLAEALECSGQFEQAIGHFGLAVELSGQDSFVRAEWARTLALAGREDETRHLLDEITRTDGRKRCSPYAIALTLLGLDEAEEALRWLDRAVAEGDKWLAWVTVDPRVDPLRQDPRFPAIITARLESGLRSSAKLASWISKTLSLPKGLMQARCCCHLHDANVEVLSIQPDVFSLGLALYESRLDKGYSLTDCTAMNAMHRKGITEVLSGDKHFV